MSTPALRRVLRLPDLVLYGIVAVTPSAPVTVFGLASSLSKGHAIVTILAAMLAMVCTAVSYGRMAALYPSAGSAYTYVGRGLNPHLGFLAGWAMLLDYLVSPLFCVIYGSLAIQRIFPGVPFFVWAAALTTIMTALNLRGIKSTARANQVLIAIMGLVLVAFDLLAIRYLLIGGGPAALFSWRPFYSPATFDLRAIAGATSFAALTYLGFDSVTTLAEEVENPRRNIMLATVLVCVFTGVFGGLLVYLGQLVWPAYTTFPNVDTAFMDVAKRVGGSALFQGMALLLFLANIGAGLTTQAGAARLLFGMGRDNVLPRKIFGRLDVRHAAPSWNIWIVAMVAFAGSQALSYELTAELLNFGAFLGFMGVNAAAMVDCWKARGRVGDRFQPWKVVVPALGFVFCSIIWIGLGQPAKIAGTIWFVVGLILLAVQTRGFRQRPILFGADTTL